MNIGYIIYSGKNRITILGKNNHSNIAVILSLFLSLMTYYIIPGKMDNGR